MIKPAQLFDLTCNDCSKKGTCKEPCIFINKLAGKGKGRRECLPPPGIDHLHCETCPESQSGCNGNCTSTNYNLKLIEIQAVKEDLRKKNISDIRNLDNVRHKAIAALRHGGFRVADIPYIVELLDISERHIYRIVKG